MKKLLPVILLIPTISLAGWINKAGKPIANTDSRKANGDFGAQLVFVADENDLFRRWATPSKSVDVKTIDKVKVNGTINSFVVFSGCKADARGNCNVSMCFRVIQPDGKVYAETPAMEVWHDKPAPPRKSLELSVQYLKVIIEPKDQLGNYVVYAQVRDNNSDSVLQLQAPFSAAK